jgi:CheY-like chemotaxis protein
VGKSTGGPIDIIVVEDVGVAQKLAHAALTRGHYKVEVAGDGMQAIDLFKKHMGSLKAVLMDIQLPGLDGLAAARVIIATWPAVRVCIVTNYDDLALRATASDAGAAAYVVKENLLVLREILAGPIARGAGDHQRRVH